MRDSQEVSGSTVKGPFSVPEYVLEMKAELSAVRTEVRDLRDETKAIKEQFREETRDLKGCIRTWGLWAAGICIPTALGIMGYLFIHFFESLRGV